MLLSEYFVIESYDQKSNMVNFNGVSSSWFKASSGDAPPARIFAQEYREQPGSQ
jgi:hypothetical protein